MKYPNCSVTGELDMFLGEEQIIVECACYMTKLTTKKLHLTYQFPTDLSWFVANSSKFQGHPAAG